MSDIRVVGASVTLAFLLAGVVSAITESSAVLGVTPVGIAIYLAVGVGLPQYLLSRRTGSRLRLACLAAAGGAFVAVAGIGAGSLHAEWSGGLVAILFAVVLGNVLGAGVREFRSGYRSTSRP
jgi:hypothetical protein